MTEALALRLAATLPGWDVAGIAVRPGVAPVASPMYQGVDATALRLRHPDGRGLWARILHNDAALFADPDVGAAAARWAGAAGIGPRVHAAEAGIVLMDDLTGSHRTATLDRLADPGVREASVRARKVVHAGPPLARTRSVFAHIEELAGVAVAAGVALPQDWAWMQASLRTAAAALRAAGSDCVPAHGDGNASNLMIGADGSVLLVDWDMAANMDPFEDLGSLLAEAHPFDPDACETFEMFHGRMDARLFNRARLCGVADDLRWGLIGSILARTSARSHLEFLKYADWRLLRGRFALRDPRFEERVRRV